MIDRKGAHANVRNRFGVWKVKRALIHGHGGFGLGLRGNNGGGAAAVCVCGYDWAGKTRIKTQSNRFQWRCIGRQSQRVCFGLNRSPNRVESNRLCGGGGGVGVWGVRFRMSTNARTSRSAETSSMPIALPWPLLLIPPQHSLHHHHERPYAPCTYTHAHNTRQRARGRGRGVRACVRGAARAKGSSGAAAYHRLHVRIDTAIEQSMLSGCGVVCISWLWSVIDQQRMGGAHSVHTTHREMTCINREGSIDRSERE